MKKISINVFRRICLVTLVVAGMHNGNVMAAATPLSSQQLSYTIPFIANKGQLGQADVAYYAPTFGGTLFVKHTGEWVYNLPAKQTSSKSVNWAFQERLLNANRPKPVARQRAKARIHYFKGQKADWQTDIASYSNVVMNEVYPGITVQLQVRGKQIEKLFTLAPNADPGRIQLQVDGVDGLRINPQDQLVLSTGVGEINFTAPVAFQTIKGKKHYIDVAYVVKGKQYGFQLGAYDKRHELVIDPLLASTFIGGDNTEAISDFEWIYDVEERDGFVFIAGVTDSTNFPVKLGYSETYNGGGYDGFISKFDSTLSTLVASTFLGGDLPDDIWGMTLDPVGSVYVVGRTWGGAGFPYIDGGYRFREDATGGLFVAKLSNDLSTLLATAFATSTNLPKAISYGNGSIYLSGRTNYPDIPATPGAYDSTCGTDGQCNPGGFGITKYFGYAIRLTPDLSALLAATYLGEKGGTDIAIAASGQVYVADTETPAFARLLSLDANLSTSLGMIKYDGHNGFKAIAVSDDAVVAAGFSRNPNLPTTDGVYDPACGTDGICDAVGPYGDYYIADAFVGKYSLDLQTTHALSYFGGSKGDAATAVAQDAYGNIIITGTIPSADLPTTPNAFDRNHNGGSDGFVAKFDANLKTLLYSTYLGGSNDDTPNAVYASNGGLVYVAGNTGSSDFPTSGDAFDQSYNGGDDDVFVSLFDMGQDSDGDSIVDSSDNCTLVDNPAQRDTDGDGFGNYCDPDVNNDMVINAADLFYLKSKFFTADPDADLNGDDVANSADLFILKSMYYGPPGPSGLAP